jgi:hypothetical protein
LPAEPVNERSFPHFDFLLSFDQLKLLNIFFFAFLYKNVKMLFWCWKTNPFFYGRVSTLGLSIEFIDEGSISLLSFLLFYDVGKLLDISFLFFLGRKCHVVIPVLGDQFCFFFLAVEYQLLVCLLNL